MARSPAHRRPRGCAAALATAPCPSGPQVALIDPMRPLMPLALGTRGFIVRKRPVAVDGPGRSAGSSSAGDRPNRASRLHAHRHRRAGAAPPADRPVCDELQRAHDSRPRRSAPPVLAEFDEVGKRSLSVSPPSGSAGCEDVWRPATCLRCRERASAAAASRSPVPRALAATLSGSVGAARESATAAVAGRASSNSTANRAVGRRNARRATAAAAPRQARGPAASGGNPRRAQRRGGKAADRSR